VTYEDGETDPYFNGTGEYIVTVVCGNCGDQVLWRPSIGIFDQADNGNDWQLEVSLDRYVQPGL
jgi:hypothetical protein